MSVTPPNVISFIELTPLRFGFTTVPFVNPDDVSVRGAEDGPMSGHTVKSYWEKEGALIVNCDDVTDAEVQFHTAQWKIRENRANPKQGL